jgi:uncharacterized protein YbcV (DUF1398 family)
MDNKIIDECSQLSLSEQITFGQVVQKLIVAGVQRYIANLVGLQKLHFGTKDETHNCSLKLNHNQTIDDSFDADKVRSAIIDIQHGRIGYQEFLRLIMEGGCTHYEVFLKGKKAIYFGRDGDFYIEAFPK